MPYNSSPRVGITSSSLQCVNLHRFPPYFPSMRSLCQIVILVLILPLFQWIATASSQSIDNSSFLTRNTLNRWSSCVPKESLQQFTMNINFIVAYNYAVKFGYDNMKNQLEDTVAYMNSILEPQTGIRVAINKVFINKEYTTHAFNQEDCPNTVWEFENSIPTWFQDSGFSDDFNSDKGLWFVYSNCFQDKFYQHFRFNGNVDSDGILAGVVSDPCGRPDFHNIPFIQQDISTMNTYGRNFNMQHISLKKFAQVFRILPTVHHSKYTAFVNGGCMDYAGSDMNSCMLRYGDQENPGLEGFSSYDKSQFCETLSLSIQNASSMGNLAVPGTEEAKNSCWIVQDMTQDEVETNEPNETTNTGEYSWETGDWSQGCQSVYGPCRQYFRSRKVSCVSNKLVNGAAMIGFETDCDPGLKPDEKMPCVVFNSPCAYTLRPTSEWTTCSAQAPCVGGVQTRERECFKGDSTTTIEPDFSKCSNLDDLGYRRLPCASAEVCKDAHWLYSKAPCNTSNCVGSEQHSQLACHKKSNGELIDSSFCGLQYSTNVRSMCLPQVCNNRSLEPSWSDNTWSACSSDITSTCGLGKKSTPAACALQKQETNGQWGNTQKLDSSLCSASLPDKIYDDCLVGSCDGYSWKVSEWSACSATTNCDIGERTRTLTCLSGGVVAGNSNDCDHLPKFRTTKDCYNASTCTLSISEVTVGGTADGMVTLTEDVVPIYSPYDTFSITISVQKASLLPSPLLSVTLLNSEFPTFSYYLGNKALSNDDNLHVDINLSHHSIRVRESDNYYIFVQSEGYLSSKSADFTLTSTCPDIQCPANSTCNDRSLECECDFGYGGTDCSVFSCELFPCKNGTCNSEAEPCLCDNGWMGETCEEECPINDCSSHGTIDTNVSSCSTCTCSGNWITDSSYVFPSATPQCSKCGLECDVGSLPDSDCSKCCNPGYSGDNCSEFYCNTSSCGNGVCGTSDGVCVCNSGWTGQTCMEECAVIDCSNHGEVDAVDSFCPSTCTCSNSWITEQTSLPTDPQCSKCSLECKFDSPHDSDCSTCLCVSNSYGNTCQCRYVSVSFTLSDKVDIDKMSEVVEKIVDELAALGKIDRALIEIVSSSMSDESSHTIQLRFLADSPCLDMDVEGNVMNIRSLLSTAIQLDSTEYTLEISYEALQSIGEAFSKRFEGQGITSLTPTLRANIDFTSQLFIEDELCTVDPCPISVSPPGLAPTPKPEPEEGDSLSVGAIVGIVIGGIVFLIILCLIIGLLLIKRRKKTSETNNTDDVHDMELANQK